MPKIFTSKTQKKGELGEQIAEKYFKKQNFTVLERNYTRKWGEIDIVAMKDKKLYFIEVKSTIGSVTRESNIRPEENMHEAKLKRLYRTIETYLFEKEIGDKTDWQLDLVCVYLNEKDKKAQILRIENIVG